MAKLNPPLLPGIVASKPINAELEGALRLLLRYHAAKFRKLEKDKPELLTVDLSHSRVPLRGPALRGYQQALLVVGLHAAYQAAYQAREMASVRFVLGKVGNILVIE